jgi:hypothetical protein
MMSTMIAVVLGVAVAVVGGLIGVQEFVQWRHNRRADQLATITCPQCRKAFGRMVIFSAHDIRWFMDSPPVELSAHVDPVPQGVSVLCPHCSTRWGFCDGELSRIPAPAQPPFIISPAATAHLAKVETWPYMEPAIVPCRGYRAYTGNELTAEFKEPYYSISYDSPKTWTLALSAIRVLIAGREFWLPASTVASLQGKTLTLAPKEVGRGQNAGMIRDLLIASA